MYIYVQHTFTTNATSECFKNYTHAQFTWTASPICAGHLLLDFLYVILCKAHQAITCREDTRTAIPRMSCT